LGAVGAPTIVQAGTNDKAALVLALLGTVALLGCRSTPGSIANAEGGAPGNGTAGTMTAAGGPSSGGGPVAMGGSGAGRATGGAPAGGAATAGGDAGGSGGQAEACPFGKDEYFLWAGTAPGSEGVNLTETYEERSTNPNVKDRSLSGVSKPSVFAYLAENPNGAAAIIAPGGGYTHSAFDKEGVDIALWLNSVGVSAFVLKYRLPGEFPGKGYVALADAQRALRTVRKLAGACGLDATHIGVVGFSAGGHLASQLETRPSAQTTPAADDIDAVDARPNFGILMYPVISMDPAIAHAGSKTALLGANPSATDVMLASSELQVTAATPPTFIGVPKADTTVKPENSVRFDTALQTAGVAHELHQYDVGSHGVAIRNASGDIALWPAQATAWLEQIDVIP
jgi:acetyl esterase/lipase